MISCIHHYFECFSMLACRSVKIISWSTLHLWWLMYLFTDKCKKTIISVYTMYYSQIMVKNHEQDGNSFNQNSWWLKISYDLMWLNNLLRFFKYYYNMSFTFHHITQLSTRASINPNCSCGHDRSSWAGYSTHFLGLTVVLSLYAWLWTVHWLLPTQQWGKAWPAANVSNSHEWEAHVWHLPQEVLHTWTIS